MAILINDNYSLQAQNKAFDARYLDIDTTWASCAAAIAGIPTYRYPGLTINISNEEWWWKDGVSDGDLVQKSLGGTSNLTGATNGLSLFNGGTCVGLGGDLSQSTTITTGSRLFTLCGGNGNYFQYNINTLASQVSGATGCVSQSMSAFPKYTITSTDGSNCGYLSIRDDQAIIQQNSTQLLICADCAYFIDNNNSQGLVYGNDYESCFVARSLVTKQYVESAVITGTTILGGGNGLSRLGNNIVLGGAMTGSSVISMGGATGLAFTDTRTVTIGLLYSGYYGDDFIAQSLVDAQYVTGLTSQAILTASNGLTKDGSDDVALGGALTKSTCIGATGYVFNVSGASSELRVQGTDNTMCMCTENAEVKLLQNTASVSASGDSIVVSTTGMVITSANDGEGITYAGNYCSGFVNRSLVDKEYVDEAIAVEVTTASNGLTKVDKNITLGGVLTGSTSVEVGDTQQLAFCNNAGDSYLEFGTYTGSGNNYVDINLTGSQAQFASYVYSGAGACTILKQTSSNICLRGSSGFVGATYYSDYSNNYTARSLVDAAYVTGKTSISGIQTATNGLTKQGTEVKLGGALTGNTIINGAHNLNINISTFNVTGATTLQNTLTLNTVGAGSVASDEILVIDSGGVVKKVDADTLGEDNNRYNIDVVTTNITLPTSGYTILISGATSLTLPAGTNGMAFKIKDVKGDALATPITIVGTIDGSANALINTDYGALELVYSSILGEWFSLAFIN